MFNIIQTSKPGGKNLLDYTRFSKQGLTSSGNSEKTTLIKDGLIIETNNGYAAQQTMRLDPGTYTFSCKTEVLSGNPSGSVSIWSGQQTAALARLATIYVQPDIVNHGTFTVPENAEGINIWLYAVGVGVRKYFELQIEAGSVETPYEPYMPYKFFGNIATPSRYQPATSADTTKFPQTLEGYIHKVFNGDESWNPDNGWYYHSGLVINSVSDDKLSLIKSTHFVSGQKNVSTSTLCLSGSRWPEIKGSAIGAETAAEVKGWFAQQFTNGTPAMILYPLPTSDGSVWNFVKDTITNDFGYLNKATGVFVKVLGATGTQSSTVVYDSYMLKGGDD